MSIPQSIAGLVEILIDKHHGNLRRSIPILLRLAPAWEALHTYQQSPAQRWSRILTPWWEELQQHMHKEETFIFPACLEGRGSTLASMLRTLELEHSDHCQVMEALSSSIEESDELIAACQTEPKDKVPFLEDAIEFRREATLMLHQLQEHINLENRVFFPLILSLDAPCHLDVKQTPNSPD